jgi:hypothetical protein
MRRFGCLELAAICLLGAWSTHGQTEKITVEKFLDGTSDLDAFAGELHLTEEALQGTPTPEQLAELRGSLPDNWKVETPQRTFVISSVPLKELLREGKTREADALVHHMLVEVHGYSAKDIKGNVNPRAELDKLLAGNEFTAVHPPSAWDLFRQRLAAWFNRLLSKIFGGLEKYPIGGKILFWSIVIVAVGFIALWLFRFTVSRDRFESMPAAEIVSASRTWQEWTRMAREAAARKDFREAVHSAYWAGIARLEDSGVVPKDRTKTPREYLRIVAEGSGRELLPRPANYRAPLAELTKRLEPIWYGNRGAGPEDFAETLKQLQEMGCQLE